MDYNKLIERLYQHGKDHGEGRTQDFFRVCLDCKDAAVALSTLQAENERLWARNTKLEVVVQSQRNGLQELRAELEAYRSGRCAEGGCAAEKDRNRVIAENEKLRDELERMKRIMRDNGIMTIPSKYPGGPTEWNIPKPRGRKEG